MGVEELVFEVFDFFVQLFDLVAQDGVIGDEAITLAFQSGKLCLHVDEAFVSDEEYLPHFNAKGLAEGGDGIDSRSFLGLVFGIENAFDSIDGDAGGIGK